MPGASEHVPSPPRSDQRGHPDGPAHHQGVGKDFGPTAATSPGRPPTLEPTDRDRDGWPAGAEGSAGAPHPAPCSEPTLGARCACCSQVFPRSATSSHSFPSRRRSAGTDTTSAMPSTPGCTDGWRRWGWNRSRRGCPCRRRSRKPPTTCSGDPSASRTCARSRSRATWPSSSARCSRAATRMTWRSHCDGSAPTSSSTTRSALELGSRQWRWAFPRLPTDWVTARSPSSHPST